MANRGLDDIADFASKARFALMAVPIAEAARIIREELGGALTTVTLESWRSGRNRPSRTKLELFSRALGIQLEDFYEDLEGFADILAGARHMAPGDKERYLRRIEERRPGALRLEVAERQDPDSVKRLFGKIGGLYILYNYSMNNEPEINRTLVSVTSPSHPFIRLSAWCVRDKDLVIAYQGGLFPVRSNLCFIMETCAGRHDEAVMIMTNNPVHQGGRVRCLYGMILSGSEDFVSHPSAARVFMEKLPGNVSVSEALERILAAGQDDVPSYCRALVGNDIAQADGEYVLRAEQLNMRQVSRLMSEETDKT